MGPHGTTPTGIAVGPIVSNPIAAAGGAGAAEVRAINRSSSAEVVYVSLPSMTIPNGQFATIRKARTGAAAQGAMAAGGLDPVPLDAAAGDTVIIDVELVGGGHQFLVLPVPIKRPPGVVRTDPPPNKRDVPLNATIVVVFSEPIDPSTLGGIRLQSGGAPVSGHVVLSGDGLRATFQQDGLLAPNADYVLSISTDVTDLTGDRLEQPVQVEFTTGSTVAAAWIATEQAALFTNPFNGEQRTFVMNVVRLDDGPVTGTFNIFYPGPGWLNSGRVTCLTIVGDTAAWVAGVIETAANDSFVGLDWGWRVVDHGPPEGGVPDQLSLADPLEEDGLGTAQDFCSTTPVTGSKFGEIQLFSLVSGNVVVASGDSISPPPPPPPVASVTVAPDSATLLIQTTVQLSAMPRDANGTALSGRPITWTSDNPTTATVDASGLVTGVGAGSVSVSATSEGVSGTAAITVVAFGAVQVTATTSGADLDPDGYAVQVEGQPAQVLPANGGEAAFSQVAPGPRVVTLSGVRSNCAVAGSSQDTVTVTSGATVSVAFAITCVQIMPTGSAIAFVRTSGGNREVFLVTGDSVPLNLTNNAAADGPPIWSPDGAKIAFVSDRNGNLEIYVMNPDGSGQVNLTNSAATESSPAWSPDGARIAFVSDRDGNAEVYVMQADGTGQVRLTSNPAADASPGWAPDGRALAFVSDRDGNQEIYLMNADSSQPVSLSNNATVDVSPVWSPDGTKIAFVSDRDGNAEIYLMNPDGTGQVNLTRSSATDGSPAWSPDGRRIVFASGGIAVINADGTGFAQIITNFSCGATTNCISRTSTGPVWSPDGSKIAFQWVSTRRVCRIGCGVATRSGISVMSPDGSPPIALVDDPVAGNGVPAWRPR